eukprot:SAG31_NODE_2455_length_5664_cov_1.921294_6_plen_145_part_00
MPEKLLPRQPSILLVCLRLHFVAAICSHTNATTVILVPVAALARMQQAVGSRTRHRTDADCHDKTRLEDPAAKNANPGISTPVPLSIGAVLQRTWRANGLLGLYAGCTTEIVATALKGALRWLVKDQLDRSCTNLVRWIVLHLF